MEMFNGWTRECDGPSSAVCAAKAQRRSKSNICPLRAIVQERHMCMECDKRNERLSPKRISFLSTSSIYFLLDDFFLLYFTDNQVL